MELDHSLAVCRRWWWIVLVSVLATVLAAVVVIGSPTRTYESKASFVIQPQAVEEGDQVRALDALVQGGTVGETYASIARSKLVRERAAESLTQRERNEHLVVAAEVINGTRIIRLTVRSGHPESAQRFAQAVSTETVAYVDGLADNYRLDPLDPPTLPKHSLPNRRSVTIVLAGVLGLMLGIALAYFADRVWRIWAPGVDEDEHSPSPGVLLWTPSPLISDGMSIADAGVEPASPLHNGAEART